MVNEAILLKTAGCILISVILLLPGVLGQKWDVIYTDTGICALKGSSVDMPCTYTYPSGLKIQKTFWFNTKMEKDVEPKDLTQDPEYNQRVEYLGDQKHNCSFRIRNLRETDSTMYRFRFTTNNNDQKWIGLQGVKLTVTDLEMKVHPETVTEGQSVTLTCNTSCTLSDKQSFIWYQNNRSLPNTNTTLALPSVTSEDTGSYSCAVKGYETLPSPAATLSVTWKQTAVLGPVVGVTVTVTLVLLAIFVFLMRRQSSTPKDKTTRTELGRTEANQKDNDSMVYSKVAMTHSASREKRDGDNEEEIQYAAVQFPRSTHQEDSHSAQASLSCNQEDVQYASIRFPCTETS